MPDSVGAELEGDSSQWSLPCLISSNADACKHGQTCGDFARLAAAFHWFFDREDRTNAHTCKQQLLFGSNCALSCESLRGSAIAAAMHGLVKLTATADGTLIV